MSGQQCDCLDRDAVSRFTWALTWVRLAGFEPATRCLEGSRSVQLSYRRRPRPPIVPVEGHATDTESAQAGREREAELANAFRP